MQVQRLPGLSGPVRKDFRKSLMKFIDVLLGQ